MKVQLSQIQLKNLRDQKKLQKSEVAYVIGDLLIAECIISGEKRVIGDSILHLNESNKKILKG